MECGSKVGCPLAGRRSNLGSARQRFESEARPLWNVAVMPERFLATCVEIAKERANRKEGQPMKEKLRRFNEKAFILAAVQADAINEGLKLIRKVDWFRLESEKLQPALHEFKNVLQALFGHHGLAWQPDNAQGLLVGHVYQFLSTARMANVTGESQIIGGHTLHSGCDFKKKCTAGSLQCLLGLTQSFPSGSVAQTSRSSIWTHLSWQSAIGVRPHLASSGFAISSS